MTVTALEGEAEEGAQEEGLHPYADEDLEAHDGLITGEEAGPEVLRPAGEEGITKRAAVVANQKCESVDICIII